MKLWFVFEENGKFIHKTQFFFFKYTPIKYEAIGKKFSKYENLITYIFSLLKMWETFNYPLQFRCTYKKLKRNVNVFIKSLKEEKPTENTERLGRRA